MEVVKRNGKREPFNFDKVQKVIDFAIEDKAMKEEFVNDLQMNIKNNISTEEIQTTLIKLAAEKMTPQTPNWQFVAAKLLAYDLYKKAGLTRGYKKFGYGNFEDLIRTLTAQGLYTKKLLKGYTKKEIAELGQYIRPERDDLFTYAGLSMLSRRYMVKGFENEVYELPQERFMVVAMHNALNEKQEDRVAFVKQLYDCLSKHEFMVATPTLMNSGKDESQMSSCFILDIDDDLWSIKDTEANAAQLSKFAGGIGAYGGRIRPRRSDIKNFKEKSNGITPWAKGFENTAKSCNQLGQREGAINITYEIHGLDVWEFYEWRTEGGEDDLKVHKIHHTINIPDIFMEQVEKRGKWYLLDTHQIEKYKGYRLEEFFDSDTDKSYSDRYWDCVNDIRIRKQEVNAIDLYKKHLQTAFQKGEPFTMFRDTANRLNPNKHCGIILATNLCTEIFQNLGFSTKGKSKIDWDKGVLIQEKQLGEAVVCNLSSLHLGKIVSEDDLARIIPIQVRALDNVIDLNFYPIPEAEYTNKRYRAIGLGVMSYHEYLAKRGIAWESEEHVQEADKLFESIAYYTIKASSDIAQEKGNYPLFEGSEWSTGEFFEKRGYNSERWIELKKQVSKYMRNGYTEAVAPTSQIALVANATRSTDPIMSRKYIEGKGDSALPVLIPSLNGATFFFYTPAHEIDQMWSVKAQAARQKHIDQGNSFNLFVRHDISAKELYDIYMESWKQGLKSVYYVRQKTSTITECESCQ